MKKISLLSLLFLVFAQISYAEKVTVVRNSEILKNQFNIRDIDGIKYVSLQEIADVFKGQLSWYHISGKAVLSINSHTVVFFFKSKEMLIDSKKNLLTSNTISNKAGLFIPLDFILSDKFVELSDYKTKLDEEKNIFYVDSVTNLNSPRVYFEDGQAKINIEMSEKLKYETKKNKQECTIIFERGKVIPEKIIYKNPLLKQIELKRYYRESKYVVKLGTGTKADFQMKEGPLELVVMISPETIEDKSAKPSQVNKQIEEVSENAGKSELNKLITIVVDAGHGGEDPGCIGASGTKEKELNLIISKEVTRLLQEDGYKVLLTRNDDTFIPLIERTAFANKNSADVFVSIHCNAAPNKPDMKGFEIYFLSEKASDPNAEDVAKRENSVVKFEKKASGKQEKLQRLLWAMVKNEFINESSELCYRITTDVIDNTQLDNRGIKQAGFYVLRGTEMPAVLVECGFLTNIKEEMRIKSPKFQKIIADSIYTGLKKYIQLKNMAQAKAGGN